MPRESRPRGVFMAVAVADREPEYAETIEFLSDAQNLGEPETDIERVETHSAWVFLGRQHAWKLLKPLHYPGLYTLSPHSRYIHCVEEMALNKALAPGVYLDVQPLTVRPDGWIRLGGEGAVLDWVIRMQRLPADRMFDRMLRENTWDVKDIESLQDYLKNYYASTRGVRISGHAYCRRLRAGIQRNCEKLLVMAPFGIDVGRIAQIARRQEQLLDMHRGLLMQRAQHGSIRDCHGSLKPEHICLSAPVRIIDRLELDPALRLLDPIEDLCFLQLECDRAGATWAGEWLVQRYIASDPMHIPNSLVDFYLSNRALTRARLAACRLAEPGANRAHWRARVEDYAARAFEAVRNAG